MKTQLRLGSIVPHGVGGPEAGQIDLIYAFLLHRYNQDIYRYMGINQIGEDLNEIVMKSPGNKIHVNIRYPAYDDFEQRSEEDQNSIRLNVVHSALIRIAEYDKKLDVSKLEEIRTEIIKNNFKLDLVYKEHVFKKDPSLVAKLIIKPNMREFRFYVLIEKSNIKKCELLIYRGGTNNFYIKALFSKGQWKSKDLFIVSGKSSESEFHIYIDRCEVELINKTNYPKPPFFEMMKAGLSKDEKEKAYKDWLHSLPPGYAAIVDHQTN